MPIKSQLADSKRHIKGLREANKLEFEVVRKAREDRLERLFAADNLKYNEELDQMGLAVRKQRF